MKIATKPKTLDDVFFFVFIYGFVILFTLIVLYPLIFVISASFSSPQSIAAGHVRLLPVNPGLGGYRAVFRNTAIWRGYLNSLYYTVAGTSISLVLTIMAGYPLSRKDFVGRKFFMFLVVFTMLFNGGLIPTYFVVRGLGMINTRWAMIIPAALGAWNVIITRTYFQANIPNELLEASRIDGCNDLTFIARVVLPLSGPIIAVMTLFYAVQQWNSFFPALLYLSNASLYPLQIILREILIQSQVQLDMLIDLESSVDQMHLAEQLKYSLIIVASVPLMLLYPVIQKYFVKGIMIGALKG